MQQKKEKVQHHICNECFLDALIFFSLYFNWECSLIDTAENFVMFYLNSLVVPLIASKIGTYIYFVTGCTLYWNSLCLEGHVESVRLLFFVFFMVLYE
jgi:hypothetical protein